MRKLVGVLIRLVVFLRPSLVSWFEAHITKETKDETESKSE